MIRNFFVGVLFTHLIWAATDSNSGFGPDSDSDSLSQEVDEILDFYSDKGITVTVKLDELRKTISASSDDNGYHKGGSDCPLRKSASDGGEDESHTDDHCDSSADEHPRPSQLSIPIFKSSFDFRLSPDVEEGANDSNTQACSSSTQYDDYCEKISHLYSFQRIKLLIDRSGKDPKVVLSALTRFWRLDCLREYTQILEMYRAELPGDAELGELVVRILGKWDKDGFLRELFVNRNSTAAMLTYIVEHLRRVPKPSHLRILKTCFASCASPAVLIEWQHRILSANEARTDIQKWQASKVAIKSLSNWIQSIEETERRPTKSISEFQPPMAAVLCWVTERGVCFVTDKPQAKSPSGQAVESGYAVTNDSLTISSVGTVQILENNQLTFTPASLQQTDAVIHVAFRNRDISSIGKTVEIYKCSKGHRPHGFPIVRSGDIILFCKPRVLAPIGRGELVRHLMTSDRESFLKNLALMLQELRVKRTNQSRQIFLAGMIL